MQKKIKDRHDFNVILWDFFTYFIVHLAKNQVIGKKRNITLLIKKLYDLSYQSCL